MVNHTMFDISRFGGHLSGLWCDYVPDIFFFSVLLFFGTFILATKLKQFKLSPFLPTKVCKTSYKYTQNDN